MKIRKLLLSTFFIIAITALALAQDAAHLAETYGVPADIGKVSVTVPPGNPKPYKNYTDAGAARLKGKVKNCRHL